MSVLQREIKRGIREENVLTRGCKYDGYLHELGFKLTSNEKSLLVYEQLINKCSIRIRFVENLCGISRVIEGREAMIADAYRIKTKAELKTLLFRSDTISFLFEQKKVHTKSAL